VNTENNEAKHYLGKVGGERRDWEGQKLEEGQR